MQDQLEWLMMSQVDWSFCSGFSAEVMTFITPTDSVFWRPHGQCIIFHTSEGNLIYHQCMRNAVCKAFSSKLMVIAFINFYFYGGENIVIASLMVVIALQVICGDGVTMISLGWTNTRDSFHRTQDLTSLFLSILLPLSFF